MNLLGAIGKKPCEKVLQKIMEELDDRKIVNKTMNTIFDFRDGLKQITYIPDIKYRKRFTFEWHQSFFSKIFEGKLPTTVKTHLWCCLTAYYREHVKNNFPNKNSVVR